MAISRGLSEKAPLAESKGGVFSCPMPTRRRGIVVGKAEGGWPRSPIRVLSSEGTVQLRVPHVSCFSRHGYHDRRHRGLYAAGLRIFIFRMSHSLIRTAPASPKAYDR